MTLQYSNMSSKLFYSTFGAEILRSSRTTNDAAISQRNFKSLISRMMKQGNTFAVTSMYFTSIVELTPNLRYDDVFLYNLIS